MNAGKKAEDACVTGPMFGSCHFMLMFALAEISINASRPGRVVGVRTGPGPGNPLQLRARGRAQRGCPCQERPHCSGIGTSSGSTRPLCQEPLHCFVTSNQPPAFFSHGSATCEFRCGQVKCSEQSTRTTGRSEWFCQETAGSCHQSGSGGSLGAAEAIMEAGGGKGEEKQTTSGQHMDGNDLPHLLKDTAGVLGLGELACRLCELGGLNLLSKLRPLYRC